MLGVLQVLAQATFLFRLWTYEMIREKKKWKFSSRGKPRYSPVKIDPYLPHSQSIAAIVSSPCIPPPPSPHIMTPWPRKRYSIQLQPSDFHFLFFPIFEPMDVTVESLDWCCVATPRWPGIIIWNGPQPDSIPLIGRTSLFRGSKWWNRSILTYQIPTLKDAN